MARVKCANNLRQLALGCASYEEAIQALPYARKYDVCNSYTWMMLVLPYIDQAAVYEGYSSINMKGYVKSYNVDGTETGPNGPIGNNVRLRESRHARLVTFICPSDRGATGNELGTTNFGARRGNYRACTSSGDMYGVATDATEGPWGPGAFSVIPDQSFDTKSARNLGVPLSGFSDGTSQTILLSEGLVVGDTVGWGGPIGMHIYGNMGGALFTASLTPNSSLPDRPIGPCPTNAGDSAYPAPCSTLGGMDWWSQSGSTSHTGARSRHGGGVNVALADGSVRFVTDRVDTATWRGMGTRAGNETISLP